MSSKQIERCLLCGNGGKHSGSEYIGKEEETGLGDGFNVSDQRERSQIIPSV